METSFSGGAEAMACMPAPRTCSRDFFPETDPILLSPPAVEDRDQHSPGLDSVVCHSVPDCHFMCPDNYALAAQPCLLVKGEQQQFWPSPPLGPWDFEREHCGQDVPSPTAVFGHHYADTPVSPDGWPAGEETFVHQEKKFADLCEDPAGLCTPASTAASSLQASTFDDISGLPLSMEPLQGLEVDVLSPEELLMMRHSSTASSPPLNLHESPAAHSVSPRDISTDASMTGARLDEPYAKLIYRAFMSQPDYTMSLQDIYQWFRDNTTKAVSAKGGWQNSIRHNLSMNAAFTKRNRKEDEEDVGSPTEDTKRANEWVLENWAVCYGVQSTTRYRKGNSRRRSGARPVSRISKRPTQHSAKRAMSGSKGGCAARDSRLRGHGCFHEKPLGRMARYGIEQGCFSPLRPSYPGPYAAEAMAVSQLGAAGRRHPAPTQRAYDGAGHYDSAPEVMAFPLAMGEHSLAQGMSSINQHCDAAAAAAATYGVPAQGGFLLGMRDVHMGYGGEQQAADEGGPARLFETMDDGPYDWSDGSD